MTQKNKKKVELLCRVKNKATMSMCDLFLWPETFFLCLQKAKNYLTKT